METRTAVDDEVAKEKWWNIVLYCRVRTRRVLFIIAFILLVFVCLISLHVSDLLSMRISRQQIFARAI